MGWSSRFCAGVTARVYVARSASFPYTSRPAANAQRMFLTPLFPSLLSLLSSSHLVKMSLIIGDDFQHILRVLNTNVDGRTKVMYALTQIKGIGRRFSNVVCKKAEIDMGKRAGELSAAELESLMVIVANPRQFRIPDWFLNRQKNYKDGKYIQQVSNQLDTSLRDDLERLKKIRNHRGLRHYWGIRVRGQHTKTTGRRGKR